MCVVLGNCPHIFAQYGFTFQFKMTFYGSVVKVIVDCTEDQFKPT